MKPLPSQHVKAVLGLDYVRDSDWKPMLKTEKGWLAYAERLAKEKNKGQKFVWYPVVPWVEWRDCFRINFRGQPEK